MADFKTLRELVKIIKFRSNLNQAEIAAEIGVSKQYLSDTINERYPFSNELRQKLYEQFTYLQDEQPTEENTMSLPLIPVDAMAGALTGSMDMIMEYDCERYIVPIFKGANFLIRVQGDSMTPRYLSGDIVACKRVGMDNLWFQWGKTYVLDTRQGALLKRIEPAEKDGFIQLCSDNTKYKPFDLPIEEINGVALVVGTIRVD